MKLKLLLVVYILFVVNCVNGFNLKVNPLNYLDLATARNQSLVLSKDHAIVYDYPKIIDPYERFKIVQIDTDRNYLVLGARNRIVIVNTNSFDKIQIDESYLPIKEKSLINRNCSNRNCANYILATLPIKKNEYNLLQCGTYFGIFQCMQSNQNKKTGFINFYDTTTHIKASKSLTLPFSSQNAYYLTPSQKLNGSDEYVLYAASSWTDSSQYLAAHHSEHYYQENDLSKKIGVSKSFVRFVEDNNRLFLFQNEFSYDIDDGEKDRDILISTSLVSQICKNKNINDDIFSKESAFYSELTAKIYCFNDNFRKGNSRNFKFDSLEFVTELINLKGLNETKKVFYAAFNTPKNQITGAAICFFDISDISSVFQKDNFKFLEENSEKYIAKNSPLNPQDCDATLTHAEKVKYKSFTSKLRYMTKAALPIKKRRASFITTNEYRITCLHVVENVDESKMQPSVKRFEDKYSNLNIIFAGTDNGKLMRIAHYFSNDYFNNDDYDEENVVILEEIQLFDKNISINEISILNNGNSKMIFAISGQQIKSIPIDFCDFYSDSCEKCLNSNTNPYYASQCYWSNNTCQSKPKLNALNLTHPFISQVEKCHLTKSVTTSTSKKELVQNVKPLFNKVKQNEHNSTQFKTSTNPSSTLLSSLSSSSLSSIMFNQMVSFENLANQILFNTSNNQQLNAVNSFISSDKKKQTQTLVNDFDEKNSTNFYIIISVIGSIFGLFIGLIIGYIIKANYSKRILEFFLAQSFLNKKQSSIKKPISSNLDIMSSNESASISNLDLPNADSLKIQSENNNNSHCMNNNLLLLRNKNNLECISRSSNSDESFGSTKSTSCCNENCVHNRSTSGSTNSGRNDALNKDYSTIQHDYGNYMSKTYLPQNKNSTKPPISVGASKNAICNRLSSISSSTDSSSYGLYNVANHQIHHQSQTCLIPQKRINAGHLPPTGNTISNKKSTHSNYDYSQIYGKIPPLFQQQHQQQEQLQSQRVKAKDYVNKRCSTISFSSLGPTESSTSSFNMAPTVICPNLWMPPSSTTSKQEIYYKNHHIRKHNSVYQSNTRTNTSNILKNDTIKTSMPLINDVKSANASVNDDGKTIKINDILYKNNSYV